MAKIFKEKFFERAPSNPSSKRDDVGYCLNCGAFTQSHKDHYYSELIRENPKLLLMIVANGLAPVININCECGCKAGIWDLDIEDYIVYDISDPPQNM